MHISLGKILPSLLAGCLVLAPCSRAHAQKAVRSSVVIPLRKEKPSAAKVTTVHDTVTLVRVDTVRIVQTVVHTDTIFKIDTLRDTCARAAALPIPIPIPLPGDHHIDNTPATLDPIPTTSVAPEPETFVLVGTGLAGIIGFAWFKRRR